jgi:hypothetical protein
VLLAKWGCLETSGPGTVRAVRTVLRNEDYSGRNGYPRLIEPELFDVVQRWLDESKRTWKSTGGRPPSEDFPLAGIALCSLCGAPMRSRRCSTTGRRTYRCSNAMEGRNLCPDSVPVLAVAAEAFLMASLDRYRDELDVFLADLVGDRQREQANRVEVMDRLMAQAAKLDRTRDRLLTDYRDQVDAGRSTAYLALEEVERLDRERERLEEAVRDAQAVVAEHADQLDPNDVRDLYDRLMAFARTQLERTTTAAERSVVLRRLMTEVLLDATPSGLPVVQGSLRLIDESLSRTHTRGSSTSTRRGSPARWSRRPTPKVRSV